jgi:hypothetical protein
MGPSGAFGPGSNARQLRPGAPFIVRSSLVRQNQNRAVNEVASDLLAFSLPFWFLIALPTAFFGVAVLAVVQIARIVATDMTAVLEMIL